MAGLETTYGPRIRVQRACHAFSAVLLPPHRVGPHLASVATLIVASLVLSMRLLLQGLRLRNHPPFRSGYLLYHEPSFPMAASVPPPHILSRSIYPRVKPNFAHPLPRRSPPDQHPQPCRQPPRSHLPPRRTQRHINTRPEPQNAPTAPQDAPDTHRRRIRLWRWGPQGADIMA